MQSKKLLFIYNSKAGKGKIRENLSDIIDIFVRNGYAVTAYSTQCQTDATRMIKESDISIYNLIVCCGGDGTLDEVITGIMSCDDKVPIGYIPAGSTNDYANSLGIPDDMLAATEYIVNGQFFPYDVGRFNNDIFVYIAAFGIFTEVSYETDQSRKNLLGHMAYILEGVKSLSSIKSYKVRIISDDMVIEEEVIYAMVTNSEYVGGIKNITGDNVKLDDGEFEITIIKRPASFKELNDIVVSLVSRSMKSECVRCFKSRYVRFETEEEVKWTLDGEFGGCHKEVIVKNESKAFFMLGKKTA